MQLRNEKRILNTAFLYLFLLSLILIIFDKLPFFNYSAYSPSSIIAFIPAFIILLIMGYNHYSYDKWLVLFIALSTVHSLISGLYYDNIATSLKHMVTLFVGFSVFIVTRHAFRIKKGELIEKVVIGSLIIPVILGFFQLFNQLGLNNNVIPEVTEFFTQHAYNKRIQLVSSEPSFAAIHLLTFIVILIFYYRRKEKFSMFPYLLIILFIFTFSAYGYGVLFLSIIFYIILGKSKDKMKSLVLLLLSFLLVFFVVPFFIQTFNVTGYYVNRFDISRIFSEQFLKDDGSAFIRVIFPYIGILQFFENPFGWGGGFYHIHFAEYIVEHFAYGLQFYEVEYNTFINPSNANPRNILSKLLSEEGIIGIVLFSLFLIGLFKRVKSNYSKFVFCLAIASMANLDSWAFVNTWFLLGIVASGYFEGRANNNLNINFKNG